MTGPKNRCPLCGMGVVVTKHNGIRRHCTQHDGWCEVHGIPMREALLKYTFPREHSLGCTLPPGHTGFCFDDVAE